ncbi:hypothetical protein [Kribbella sp. CA-293567]|uniref:hypothetical protein n=1 Tax=Kribbella sp. CA-293567 TaxID=3002436 RepID=UPI0022DCE55D|nr:hypothetical protein [Kribbella sp. CA-293567]WBQ04443.1 hypothetical protein OX958_31330 [Kribbella sp. CA-293567]
MRVAEWLENHADRLAERARWRADVAKLVVTFTSGVAATIVGTALQVDPTNGTDRVATCLLGAAVVFALAVLVLDRLREPDHAAVLTESKIHGWDDAKLIAELRVEVVATAQFNRRWLEVVRVALLVQVSTAIAAGTLAAISLLRDAGP